MTQPPDGPPQPNEPGWGEQPWSPPPPPPGWGQQPPGGGDHPVPGPGGPDNYSPTDAVQYGWRAFQANVGPLIGVAAIVLVASMVVTALMAWIFGGSVVSYDVDDGFEFNPLVLVGNAITNLVALILSAGAIRIALDVVEGRGVDIGEMFTRFDIVQVVVAGVLLSIATSIGLMLCLLPGIAIAFLTSFTNYFIIGKGEDAITAIKSSFELVASNIGAVILFALLAFACMLGGAIACLVGLLVAFPVVLVAAAYTFRVLQNEPVAQV